MPLASSILMALALYTMNMAYGYFVESRARRQLAGRFGEYVPPEIVARMARDPARYDMQPKEAELTILFSDVRDFTRTSEGLKPRELGEYINEYLTAMSAVIRNRHGGTLDKYIGDAIMAFWGAPLEDPRQGRRALLAALDMQKECEALNARFAARGWPPLRIGVGVNSGRVRVGDMGSQVRRAYTAMGDAVNVASRLEGRTKDYGVGSLVGEGTPGLAPDLLFPRRGRIKGKGVGGALSQETFALALGAGLEKLSVQMTVDQQAAIALFESLGFKAEALLRDHVRDVEGKTHDIVVLGHNNAQVQAQMEAYGLPGAVQH